MHRKRAFTPLTLIGLLAGALVISPAHAIIIGTGDVNPLGRGPGDTDVTGQLIVVEDGTLTADAIPGSTVQGVVSNIDISGVATTVNLVGVGGPLAAGIQGHTNLTVSGGATVNATNSTSNLIGQNAGSSANVIITGADTSVNFLNNRVLSLGTGLKGPSATPDAATNVVLDILDGAALNTDRGNIAPRFFPIDPDEALPGNITATVNVSGQGSEWNMSSGSLTIGDGATNHGILNISDGGKVNITPNNPFFNAG